jgi:phosphatidylglycerol:prolipoprotein diacylglycerol transferase
VHRIALDFGPFKLHWFGVLVALGFLAGLWTAGRRAPRAGIAPEHIYDLGFWLIGGAILGARSLYVLSYWREQFADHPLEIFMVQNGGLVYYGGLVGSSLGCIIFARRKKLPLWRLADAVAPSIALGYAFGRLGCLMNGCCYGRACSLPWAITFPPGHETHPLGGVAVPVHPTQIYDALLSLAFYGVLEALYRRKKFEGQVFGVYLVGYALLRSFVEMFRGDYPQYYLGGHVTPAQLVSIGILLAGLALLWRLPRAGAHPEPTPNRHG